MPFVETLATHHDRKGFDCGRQSLNDFLQRQARQNADRHLGVTHVVVAERGDIKVLGYYTLLTSAVDPVIVPEKRLPRDSMGVILLGRLATDRTVQGQGLGRQMVLRAMSEASQVAKRVGVYAFTLHAIDDQARDWYLKLDYEFRSFMDDPNHLYVPMQYIAQLDLPAPTDEL